MRTFPSLAAFAAHMRAVRAAVPAAEKQGLEHGAKLIEAEAKAEIGHYQDAAGPFEAWDPLTARTKADRVSKGFPADNPLLRSGELLHSIGHKVDGHTAVIGSDSDIAVYQERGTPNAANPIPPRSFLGAAGFRKGEAAAKVMGDAVAQVVAGKPPAAG